MREIKPVTGRQRAALVILLCLAAVLAVCWIAAGIASNFRPHNAADFGFDDLQSGRDADGDGIDDFADMVAGAREYIATDPEYVSKYYAGGYPDEGEGVCTDVIWHAFAAAGYSLKDMVDADIAADAGAYFAEGEAHDPNIDFRRVRNLLVFFRRNAEELTVSLRRPSDWIPGDIVVFDGHIAICSDVRNGSGIPYIIHHADNIRRAVEADDIGSMTVVGHFRFSRDGAEK